MKKNIFWVLICTYALYGMEQKSSVSLADHITSPLTTLSIYESKESSCIVSANIANARQMPSKQSKVYEDWRPQMQKIAKGLSSFAITSDEKLLIGVSCRHVSIYSAEAYNVIKTFPIFDRNQFLGISPDDKYLFIFNFWDKTIYVYNISDLNNCYLYKKLVGHTQLVNSLVVVGNLVVSGSLDGTIKLWDLDNQDSNFLSTILSVGEIKRLLVSSNSNYIFLSTSKGVFDVLDISDKKNIIQYPIGLLVESLYITQEPQLPREVIKICGDYYLLCSHSNEIIIYSLVNGVPKDSIAKLEHFDRIGSHLFVPSLNYLIISIGVQAYIWNLKDPQRPHLLNSIKIDQTNKAITAFAIEDDRFLCVGTAMGNVFVLDLQNPCQIKFLNCFNACVVNKPSFSSLPDVGIARLSLKKNKLISFQPYRTLKICQLPK